MKTGVIFSIGATVVGLGAMFAAFLGNAKSYVTIAEAKEKSNTGVYLPGDLQKETLFTDTARREVRFVLKDEVGDQVKVVLKGAPPANMGNATRVVVVGSMKGEEFVAHNILLKCPSKYEGEEKGATQG